MNTFAQAVEHDSNTSYTTNGMTTFQSSLDPCVDLFFSIGASRGKDIRNQFDAAYAANPELTLRMLFWARDIRGGSGERDTVRKLLSHLEKTRPDVLVKILPLVPEYGRWDDLLIFTDPYVKITAYSLIHRALRDGNGLAAKWMPRKGPIAKELRDYINETPKGYRKLLVNLTNVVETKMCANQWDGINYSHVPSLAAARYQKAFGRHDTTGYEAYKQGLANGSAKVNASAVYPYDVIKSIKNGDVTVATAQWDALPNYLGEDFILPMVDVSSSMECTVGGSMNMTCMDMSVALGLYLADKQKGPFKDLFLTFSQNCRIQKLEGNISEKVNQLYSADWGGNTSIERAYSEILRVAKTHNVPQDQMPKYILILSDMEFDVATYGNNVRAFEMARNMFQKEGYELPKIIFWNLNARSGNVPVKFGENGTALVSGFSPAILKNILAARSFTPVDIMMDTLNSERYNPVSDVI